LRFIQRAAQAFLFSLVGLTVACNAAEPVVNKDYRVLERPQPTASGNKIEVLEFFYYGCPHCYDLQSALEPWVKKQPGDVEYKRVPTVFRDSWIPLTKTFYTLEALGALDKLHQDVFDAVHNKKLDLNDPKLMAKWAEQHGVDAKKFSDMYNSFTVESKSQQSVQKTKNYGITGTPSVVVAGKYLTSPSMTGNYQSFLAVLDQLVAKARQEGAGKKAG